MDNSTTTGGSGLLPLLDLSSLTNFVYTNSAGAVDVAGYSGSEARGSGLVESGRQSAIAGSPSAPLTWPSAVATVDLAAPSISGPVTNIINVGTVNLGAGKVNTATW